MELPGIDEIVFDRIARPDHPRPLEAGNGGQQLQLHIPGQRGGDSVGINRGIVEPLGLQEDLVAVAAGEAHHLVLDGGAIARTDTLDLAGIERRPVQIGLDQPMGTGGRAGDVALNLAGGDPAGEKREGLGRIVAGLRLETRPIDGAAVEPRRRSGLETAQAESKPLQGLGKAKRRRLAYPARRDLLLADMNEAAEEGAGGQDDPPGRDCPAVAGHHTDRAAGAIEDEILRPAFGDVEIGLRRQEVLHRLAIELAVRLGPRSPYRRTLAAVQNPELDARAVGHPPHDTIEGVDLADQVPFREPADSGIAGHLADGGAPMGQKQGPGAQPCRGGRGLAAGMPAADHDHIVSRHGGAL